MSNPWLVILKELALSKTEKEVVKRFEEESEGRSFLPIADILRSHRRTDEALELLTDGLARHPTFTVARVVLARELLGKGHVESAWTTLEDSPSNLRDNLLAQKLRFKISILLADDRAARSTLEHLKQHQMLDQESRRLADQLEVSGIEAPRQLLINQYEVRGIPVQLPEQPVPEDSRNDQETSRSQIDRGNSKALEPVVLNSGTLSSSLTNNLPHSNQVAGTNSNEEPTSTVSSMTGPGVGLKESESLIDDDPTFNFHVLPLEQIFRPEDGASGHPSGEMKGGVELDSTTLADIYYKQGHYSRALRIYRRLLHMTPQNDFLKRKVSELVRLEQSQNADDLTIDPGLVDRMENLAIVDNQIDFLNGLLVRL